MLCQNVIFYLFIFIEIYLYKYILYELLEKHFEYFCFFFLAHFPTLGGRGVGRTVPFSLFSFSNYFNSIMLYTQEQKYRSIEAVAAQGHKV